MTNRIIAKAEKPGIYERPLCCGRKMNKAGFARLFKGRTSRRVQVYRCPVCGRTTIKTVKEEKMVTETRKQITCEACEVKPATGRCQNPDYSGYELCDECIREYDSRPHGIIEAGKQRNRN